MVKRSDNVDVGQQLSVDEFLDLLHYSPNDCHRDEKTIVIRNPVVVKPYVLPQKYVEIFNFVFLRVEIDIANNVVRIWSRYERKIDTPNHPEDEVGQKTPGYMDESNVYVMGKPEYEITGMLKAE